MNVSLLRKIIPYLGRQKNLVPILVALVLVCITFLLGWNIGYSSYNSLVASSQVLQNNYDKLHEEYTVMRSKYQEMQDELNQIRDKYESEKNEPTVKTVIYDKYGWLNTNEVQWLAVVLGKDDVFEGRIVISTRVGTEVDWSYISGGSIIFSVLGPKLLKVFDAGRIQDEYIFKFIAEESGDYRLIFSDPTYRSRVELYYNCPTTIRELDVNR